jgi:hypothetical protein
MTGQQAFFDLLFWKDFASNAAATILGLVLGIPFALFLARRGQTLAEASGKRRELQLATNRKGQVLASLGAELVADLQSIEWLSDFFWNIDFKSDLNEHADAFLRRGLLRTDTWQAFSDGGLLRWVDDPLTLDVFSQAYHTLRAINRHIDKLFEATYIGGPNATTFVLAAIKTTLRYALNDSKISIQAAISAAKETGA